MKRWACSSCRFLHHFFPSSTSCTLWPRWTAKGGWSAGSIWVSSWCNGISCTTASTHPPGLRQNAGACCTCLFPLWLFMCLSRSALQVGPQKVDPETLKTPYSQIQVYILIIWQNASAYNHLHISPYFKLKTQYITLFKYVSVSIMILAIKHLDKLQKLMQQFKQTPSKFWRVPM